METVEVKAEFLFELKSKQDWVNRVPQCLPKKTRAGETLLWINKDGYVFEIGRDFEQAEKDQSYPCKVYRTISVSASKGYFPLAINRNINSAHGYTEGSDLPPLPPAA